MKLEWTEAYSVGIKELDDQHKELIKMINLLDEGSRTEDFLSTLNKVLDELMAYVHLHFHTEELYMESAHYEEFESHKLIHQRLTEEVNKRINDIISREPSALDLIKLYNFLSQWVTNHVLETDQAYRASLAHMQDSEE